MRLLVLLKVREIFSEGPDMMVSLIDKGVLEESRGSVFGSRWVVSMA
jgi:hypothetical protein